MADVMSLLEQVNMASDTWYSAIDLANTFISILGKDRKERFLICSKRTKGYSIGLLEGPVNTLAFCQNIVWTDVDYLDLYVEYDISIFCW